MTAPATEIGLPWRDADRQHVAFQFGMWTFLATETLFFGALLFFYTVARLSHGAGFAEGAREASVVFGTVNTAVLMTSSLTMALAERAAKEGLRGVARAMLIATVALGLTFLLLKGFEYREDVTKHLLPGGDFPIRVMGAAQFWAFYWTVTPVHAIHLSIGLGLIARLLWLDRSARMLPRWMLVEGTALYWHLVDIVWVILYPLLYLVAR